MSSTPELPEFILEDFDKSRLPLWQSREIPLPLSFTELVWIPKIPTRSATSTRPPSPSRHPSRAPTAAWCTCGLAIRNAQALSYSILTLGRL